uniref:WPP domain-containing protein n=1 Tax=Oryza punctata TaxID=4537 RepID=A0A0E0LWF7_ORYPU
MENGAVGSPAAEVEVGAYPGSSPVINTKGRGLRRWRRIPREQHKEGSAGGDATDEDSAQLHKRRIPLPAGARRGKLHEVVLDEEEESCTASVESRFVPPAKLDPSLGTLVASAGFSVGAGGADSDNSEDRSSGSRSSTAASAPRRHDSSPFAARDRAPRSSLHGKISHRAARARAIAAAEAENSRSGVDSDPRSGANAAGNGIHNFKENVSAVGRLAQDSDADAAERSVGKNGGIGSRMESSADPFAESILLLQRTQEALENEIKMFAVISKESSDNFDGNDDDWSGLVHLAEPLEETSQSVDPESRLEEASYLGQLFLEKTEAEIQSIILTRAAQTWEHLADDQIALYNAQKSLSGDYKQLELKLQHTKNRAAMLEEMAEKLKAECKDLSGSSEVLRLQSRASRVFLFCFIQFVLLFTAAGTFLARLLPSPTDDVLLPT